MGSSPLGPASQAVLARARALTAAQPPAPWQGPREAAVGGLWAGGWTRDEHLLFVSHSGYSLVHPTTGERLVRDHDQARAYEAFSRATLTFVVPATGEVVPVFGRPGGDGLHETDDGWSVNVLYPWWPLASIVLDPPSTPGVPSDYWDRVHLLDLVGYATGGWLGCGFSPSGRHLVVFDSASAAILAR